MTVEARWERLWDILPHRTIHEMVVARKAQAAARDLAVAAADLRGKEGECVACGSFEGEAHMEGCEVAGALARIATLGQPAEAGEGSE